MEIYVSYLQQILSFPSHFRWLEMKNFLCQPTMVADNISLFVPPPHPRRHFSYLQAWNKNNLIDTTFLKGSVQKMTGSWEQTSMVWAALKDARSKWRLLPIIWFDLANAYGAALHVLILFALRRYNIP